MTLAFAGVSNCLAATLTNPLNVVKIRMQLHGEGFSARSAPALGMARFILAQEGVRWLWAGLSASLLREGFYSSIRLGSYDFFKAMVAVSSAQAEQPLWQEVTAGCDRPVYTHTLMRGQNAYGASTRGPPRDNLLMRPHGWLPRCICVLV